MGYSTVLLIGARGYLGSQILDAIVKKNKYKVSVLIRPGSNADKIEAMDGVTVVRGDMMDKESLVAAMDKVDVVVNSANGYGVGHPEIDTEGATNVVDACKAKKVKRYIYCSVLACDEEECKHVEHFYNKKLHEDYIKEQGIPFIALRPGAFLDQSTDFLGDNIKSGAGWAMSVWSKTTPIGMIYTPDLAQYFADAIDLPQDANGVLTVGWSRPVSYQELVKIVSAKVGRDMWCIEFPWVARMFGIYTVGWFSPLISEMLIMFNYFGSGVYVNSDTAKQEKYLGKPPTPEDVIGRYVDGVLAAMAKEEAEATSSST